MNTDAPEKPKTASERAAADLQAALRRLRTEEGWKAWLISKSHLHTHSLMNQLLIWTQFPDATICRGKVQWEKNFNRRLMVGAKKLWIRAPRTKKLDEIDPATGENVVKRYFKNVKVYDVSQTYPIPGLPVKPVQPPREPIEGESHRAWILKLSRLANENALTVRFESMVHTTKRGWFDSEKGEVVVSSDESANGQVRVLVHELCHAFGYEDYSEGRGRTEACTEAAAFIACSMIGLDVSGESVTYIAGWHDDAEDVIEADLKKIDQIARRIAAAGEDS